jgi:hypothetical protein
MDTALWQYQHADKNAILFIIAHPMINIGETILKNYWIDCVDDIATVSYYIKQSDGFKEMVDITTIQHVYTKWTYDVCPIKFNMEDVRSSNVKV